MKVNQIQFQSTSNANSSSLKKNFNQIDLGFMGNLKAEEVSDKLSKGGINMVFTPKNQASNISFNGKDVKNKNILVTGGAGYIGSHTAKFLIENGYNVVVLDNLSLGKDGAIEQLEHIAEKNNSKFKFYKVDLADTSSVGGILKDNKIDAVVHFAAYSLVGESVKDPMKYYINNTGKTAMLLNEMIKANVKKIVFSSTAATYGNPDETPIKETTPQNPINPYGSSKLMIEKMMDDEDKANDLKSIRLRYFNVAGAATDGALGEAHDPETHLIPNVLKPLTMGNGNTFKLFGTNYPTPDGTCVRDYIHVEDLARAHYLALEKLFDGGETSVYNLGSGKGYSVKEVYDTCCKVTGKEIPLEIQGPREGDPPTLIASNEKAEKELGFKPEKTLEDMISTAWNWIKNPKF